MTRQTTTRREGERATSGRACQCRDALMRALEPSSQEVEGRDLKMLAGVQFPVICDGGARTHCRHKGRTDARTEGAPIVVYWISEMVALKARLMMWLKEFSSCRKRVNGSDIVESDYCAPLALGMQVLESPPTHTVDA